MLKGFVLKIEFFWFLWILLFFLLFPWSPIQFSNPCFEFFRTWLFMLLPSFLCLLIYESTNGAERKPERVGSLVAVVPIALLFLLMATIYGYGMSDAINLNQNPSSTPIRKIHVGSKLVAIYRTSDVADSFFEILQEWSIGHGLKLVRYIEHRASFDNVEVVDEHTIKYGLEGGTTTLLW